MERDIEIEPMKWGTCPKCACNLDENGPRIYFNHQPGHPMHGHIKKIECDVCDAIIWGA
jgi:hypothetical protein